MTKSWKTPTPDAVAAAVALLGRAGQYRYFFDRLQNPLWLQPLKAKAIFAAPPKAIHNEKEGTVEFQPWAASRYLVRMSELSEAHEDVLNVAMSIPETDNVLVHLDLLRIAGNLPPVLAVRLAERAPHWIRSRSLITSDRAATALIAHLANGGETARALELTRVLFEILPSKPSPAGEGWPREVHARLEQGMYGELIGTVREPLVKGAGLEALRTFCSLLEAAVAASRSADEVELEDYSFVWRATIDGSGNSYDDVRNSLVNAVRDSALELSATSDEAVKQVLDTLEKYGFTVFGRIALFVLRARPVVPMIEAILTDRARFDALGFRREYVMLLRDFFPRLSEGGQKQLLTWLSAAPTNAELEESDRRRWQLERLAPLSGMLPETEQALLDQLVQEFGKPEAPDVVTPRFAVWTGPKSPKSTEELSAMDDDDLMRFLGEWKATSRVMADSPEGLGRMLTSAVSRDPNRFSLIATRLQGFSPTYVRSAIQGFQEGARQGRTFPWEPVLKLCAWVLQQPYDYAREHGTHPFEEDPGWSWARRSIATLLDTGFEDKDTAIPIVLKDSAWTLLAELTDDDNPNSAYEAEYGGSNMDPATLSLNTTRGQAFHAVVRYALWLQRNSEDPDKFSLSDALEVRSVLDAHLDVNRDPSLAIRSVYGQWFPWLVLMDRDWAVGNASRIFPTEDAAIDYWHGAWDTYVKFNPPYNNIAEALSTQYAAAVLKLDTVSQERQEGGEAARELAQHVVVLFGRGQLENSSLLQDFFHHAPDWLRAAAISHIGWSLGQGGEIPADVIERFQSLWEQRRANAEAAPGKAKEELEAFGSWASSKLFPAAWFLAELERVLRLARDIDRDHTVMERLNELANELPRETVHVAHLMVEFDAGWGPSGWESELEHILSAALASGDQEARKEALSLVDLLGRKGFLSFRELRK
ncbi:MAG TPA: hypothetical protein VF858_07555 [Gemmatimonadaceae bacterium]